MTPPENRPVRNLAHETRRTRPCPGAATAGFVILEISPLPATNSPDQLATLIRDQVDVLDAVLSEIEMTGVRSAAHFDELEERATQAARGVREAFRKGVWR